MDWNASAGSGDPCARLSTHSKRANRPGRYRWRGNDGGQSPRGPMPSCWLRFGLIWKPHLSRAKGIARFGLGCVS